MSPTRPTTGSRSSTRRAPSCGRGEATSTASRPRRGRAPSPRSARLPYPADSVATSTRPWGSPSTLRGTSTSPTRATSGFKSWMRPALRSRLGPGHQQRCRHEHLRRRRAVPAGLAGHSGRRVRVAAGHRRGPVSQRLRRRHGEPSDPEIRFVGRVPSRVGPGSEHRRQQRGLYGRQPMPGGPGGRAAARSTPRRGFPRTSSETFTSPTRPTTGSRSRRPPGAS